MFSLPPDEKPESDLTYLSIPPTRYPRLKIYVTIGVPVPLRVAEM